MSRPKLLCRGVVTEIFLSRRKFLCHFSCVGVGRRAVWYVLESRRKFLCHFSCVGVGDGVTVSDDVVDSRVAVGLLSARAGLFHRNLGEVIPACCVVWRLFLACVLNVTAALYRQLDGTISECAVEGTYGSRYLLFLLQGMRVVE